ncbi:MAG TPA: GAF domain-containing protein [Coleofasciculaceae cyanobacterium]
MKTISLKCKPDYCTLAALSPIGIFHADSAGDTLSVSDRWCEIAGITAAEARGKGWVQALHPHDRERVVAEWNRAVQENLPFQSEYRFQHPDGKVSWVAAEARAEKNKTGAVRGYVGTITDITERRETEEELREYRQRLEELVAERTAELQRENEQLKQEIALRELQLQTLHRISEIHLSTQSLTTTCQEIVEEISTATGFPIVAIERYDDSRQMMVFEAMKGVPLPENSSVLEVPADQTLSGTVVRTGQPVIKTYALGESKQCDSNENLNKLGIKTFICMPMMVKGRAIGTLSLAHPEVVELDEHLPQWIASLANYVASLVDRKIAEEALRESEERFRQMAENIHEVFWMADLELSQILYISPAYEEIWGRTCASLYEQPRSFVNAIHPDDRDRILAVFKQQRQSGFSEEYRIVQPDGSVRWIWDRGFPVRNQAGQLHCLVGVSQDITERKQVTEAVKQQKELLQTIFDHIPVMVGFFDAAGQLQMVNREWQRILGLSLQQMQNRNLFAKFYPDLEYRQFVLNHITAATGKWADFKTRDRDGRVLDTSWANVQLSDGSTIGIGQDITDRKQMEEALRQQFRREQLEAMIAQRIHQSLNLQEILNTTVVEAQKFLTCDRVLIYRLQPDGSGIVVVESVGDDWRPIAGTIIHDCCFTQTYSSLYRQGRVQAVENIYTAGLTPCHVDLLAQFQVKANLVVPIVQEEELWGLLVAQQCSQTRQWQPLEIDLLKSLATQAAIAIQKSELYEQAQAELAQRQQAEAVLRQQFLKERLMAQIAQRIRQSLNLEEILNTTVAEVRQFLACDRVLIYRVWPNGTGSAVTEAVVPGWPAVLGRTFPEEVFPQEFHELYRQGRILAITDIEKAQVSPCLAEFVQQFGVKAKLVVPILQEEALWGLLIAHQCREPRQWQPLEIDLLKNLATQLAIALQQSELYKQSRTATAQALTQAEQLEQALWELQRTQAQLVQSEKMSSLGQLVAGVAHEINNPVSFIYGNVVHANNYIQDILGLIELYQQYYPNPVSEISSEIEAIDLEFLMEDLPQLLCSMKVGAERICEIVSALRNFSRLAEAEIKAVDIHEGLDSTLTILQNRLRASGQHPEIQVIKEYGNLPQVECYAGQLNQVFMNLLSNAIDAITSRLLADTASAVANTNDALEELNVSQELNVGKLNVESSTQTNLQPANLQPTNLQPAIPCIWIRTEVVGDRKIVIRIADNGPGMTEQVKARIFDPFYTTKPVGSGTGLGLSISYQIVVEKHRGQLRCFSELGQGTEFAIEIPIVAPAQKLN